jgi:multimeric flavodoxin WrbA
MSKSFGDLKAIFINCSLERDAGKSHTARLIAHARTVMEKQGVAVETVHALAHRIAFGMKPDMTEHGWEHDDWPALFKRVAAADILVLGSPIWLGVKSSVCTLIIERLYSNSHTQNARGQYAYYGKVGGCLVTGNEDGVKAVSTDILYALQHIGFSIPPAADAGWIGEAGPGPSYGDAVPGTSVPAGFDNEFTNRNTTIMCFNLMHLARLYKQAGGFPTQGNQVDAFGEEQRFGYPLDAKGRYIDAQSTG